MMLLQALNGSCREVLHICTEILTVVQTYSPAAVVEMARLNYELRMSLAAIALESEVLRARVQNVVARLAD